MKVIITGASRGIGRGIARVLAAKEHHVGLLARSEEELNTLKEQIEEKGGKAEVEVCDLRDLKSVEQAFSNMIEKLNGVDALINNAGLIIRKHINDLSVDEWHAMVETNISGPFYCVKQVLPVMTSQSYGHIINISSISGKFPLKNGSAYACTKYAINGFSESLFLELRDLNIKTSTIFPGSIDRDDHQTAKNRWKVHPDEVGEAVHSMLQTSPQNCIRELEIRPLRKA